MAQKTLAIILVLVALFPIRTIAEYSSFNHVLSPQSTQSEKISLRKTIGKSLLLPGLGEFSIGENRRGRFFIRNEMGFWLLLAGSLWSVSGDDSRLRAYAIRYAGADLSGKDEQFLVNMSTYEDMDAYNAYQQRARSPFDTYSSEAGYDWSWESEDRRLIYRDYLIRRDKVRSVASFTIGGMILNRILSAMDVVSLSRKRVLDAEVQQTPEGVEFRLNFRF